MVFSTLHAAATLAANFRPLTFGRLLTQVQDGAGGSKAFSSGALMSLFRQSEAPYPVHPPLLLRTVNNGPAGGNV